MIQHRAVLRFTICALVMLDCGREMLPGLYARCANAQVHECRRHARQNRPSTVTTISRNGLPHSSSVRSRTKTSRPFRLRSWTATRTVLAMGFGHADVPRQQPATTADTIYRVGSVSKLFTDFAVMQLVAAGKLDIDADVRKYLPDFSPQNPFDTPITLAATDVAPVGPRARVARRALLRRHRARRSPIPSRASTTPRSSTSQARAPSIRTPVFRSRGLSSNKLVGKPFEDHVREVAS